MRAAAILWGLLAFAYLIKVWDEGRHHSVYPIFELASHNWWQEVTLYGSYGDLDLYRYPPTFAILLTPFAVLPWWVGMILWNFLGIALLLRALRVLVTEIFPGEWSPRRAGMFLVLAVAGSVRGIWAAQSNAHLLALAIFAVAAVLRREWWRAAAFLAGAVFIKLWPVALLMLLASYWPRALIGRFLVCCAGLGLLPFLTARATWVMSEYRQYYESLVRTSQLRWPGNRDARTIWEAIHPQLDAQGSAGITVLPASSTAAYLVLQAATAAGVLAWCWWQRRRGVSQRRLLTLTLAAWAAWQLLFGPATERLTYGLIAPFTSWAILASPPKTLEHRLAWASWWLTAILGSGEVERALLPLFEGARAIQPFGVVVFLVWLALHGRHRDPADPEPARPPEQADAAA